MKPSVYEIRKHLTSGMAKRKCLVCKKELHGQMLDFPGQMRCGTCGVTYQIEGSKLSKKLLDAVGITAAQVGKVYCDVFEELPIYRAYWEEIGLPVPLGTFRFPIRRRKIISDEQVETFYTWLWCNRIRFRPHYEENFKWDDIGAKFGSEDERSLIIKPGDLS